MGVAMSRQQDQQRARRNRREGVTGPGRAKREQQRQAELLIAQVLNALSYRDAVVDDLEQQAGRLLFEIKGLGWPSSRDTAELCGISLREAVRLRHLAQAASDADDLSASTPRLDGQKAGE